MYIGIEKLFGYEKVAKRIANIRFTKKEKDVMWVMELRSGICEQYDIRRKCLIYPQNDRIICTNKNLRSAGQRVFCPKRVLRADG